MLRRYLSLLMAPMLATALALAIAAPVRADDDSDSDSDSDRRSACPCFTKAEARGAVRAAFAEVGSENFVCDSEIDVRGIEKSANADFVVFDGPVGEPGRGRELDLEASLLTAGSEVQRAFCSVENSDGVLVSEDPITEAQAVACVQILGKICLENLPMAKDDDDDSDSDSDSDSDRSKRSHDDDD